MENTKGYYPKRITMARIYHGITMQKLADMMGVSKQLVSLWEKGERTMSNAMIHGFCAILELPHNYLTDKNIVIIMERDDLVFYNKN